MWVSPEERGRGVGERLLREILGWARGLDAATMTLWVTDGNGAARRLYERVGFRSTGERGTMPHTAANGTERLRLVFHR